MENKDKKALAENACTPNTISDGNFNFDIANVTIKKLDALAPRQSHHRSGRQKRFF